MSDDARSKTDAEIMRLLHADDQSALQVVLREVVPAIWPLLKRKFGDGLSDEDLEEVFALALEKLWRNRQSFDLDKGDLEGWFYVIAKNVAVDRARRQRIKTSLPRLVVEPTPTAEGSSVNLEKTLALAIKKLNHREREVVAPLFTGEDIAAVELAKKLKTSSGAVRALRFRALQKLRSELAKFGYRVTREKPLGDERA